MVVGRASFVALAIGCSLGPGTSHAERIDVPLSVMMTLGGTVETDCHERCTISYRVIVTDEGTEDAYARDCVARALDADGAEALRAPVAIGFPAGGFVQPGAPFEQQGTILVHVPIEVRASITQLDAACLAYRWDGPPPI